MIEGRGGAVCVKLVGAMQVIFKRSLLVNYAASQE